MKEIIYIDRVTGQREVEKVYGWRALQFLYGDHWISRWLGSFLLPFLVKFPFFSAYYGALQKSPTSAKKIAPFIQKYDVEVTEFLDSPTNFASFNDFFIRKLKPEARPIASGANVAVIPADGRYYFYGHIEKNEGFIVKGKKLNLPALLQDEKLAAEYAGGSLVLARLCPSDYHRFHFPCDCIPGETRYINQYLYSVNPIAVRKNVNVFTENKRTICPLQTEAFGQVLFLEIGATNVGSIRQTYTPFKHYPKGAEKGYFEFGASALILLFKEGTIQFDADLLEATRQGLEIRCLMGQRMGSSI